MKTINQKEVNCVMLKFSKTVDTGVSPDICKGA